MRAYESTIIIHPSLDEKEVKDLIKKFEDLINSLGKLDNVSVMGKRKLAYEINKQKEAIYVLYTFEAEPDAIAELERNYRITDNILKFITVRKVED